MAFVFKVVMVLFKNPKWVIFSMYMDSIFGKLSNLFDKVSSRSESGLGFLVAWSWKMSKEMRRFGLEKKNY